MGFLNKIMFWKKEDDLTKLKRELRDITKTNTGVEEKAMNPDYDVTGQDQQSLISQPQITRTGLEPSLASSGSQPGSQGIAQGRNDYWGNSMNSMGRVNPNNINQQNQELLNKNLEVISTKIDALRMAIDNINQRLNNIEQQLKNRW